MLEIRRLKVLREVALRGSITAAAEALSYTPSAVSQQIAALEREMAAVLVERGPRSIALTEAGRVLVEHTEGVLEQLDLADEQVRAIAGLKGGRLRLATFRSVGETLVAQALMDFHLAYPAVELALTEGEPEEYLDRLARAELDLALSFDYDGIPPPHDDTLACEHLLTEEMLIALPKDHQLATRTTVTLADLAAESWIISSTRSSVHAFTATICRWEGFEPQVAFEIDDYHMAQALVAASVGVTFLPALSTRTAHPGVRVLPVRPRPPRRRIYTMQRELERVSPCVAEMTRLLREAAAAP